MICNKSIFKNNRVLVQWFIIKRTNFGIDYEIPDLHVKIPFLYDQTVIMAHIVRNDNRNDKYGHSPNDVVTLVYFYKFDNLVGHYFIILDKKNEYYLDECGEIEMHKTLLTYVEKIDTCLWTMLHYNTIK